MLNCENCGAPLDPYKWRCDYCGAYYFDLTAWDFTENKPTFVKFKAPQGTITCLAKPELKDIEVSRDTVDYTDRIGCKLMSMTTSINCNIGVNFRCIQNPKSKELYRVEIDND